MAGIIRQTGAWFRYEDESGEPIERDGEVYKWQGRDRCVEFMRTHPTFLQELENRLRGVDIEAPDAEPTSEEGYEDNVEVITLKEEE
ncbi:hypothetical protein QO179_23880 [Bacillus stercoris]|nr:hypothetical protein [Bacillus stercoris]